jgi:thiol-disulfide isomerase/thioredoxin
MKNWPRLLIGCVLLVSTLPALAATWLTDLEAGKAQAAKEGKNVLINFTGSDWCPWCIKLRQEIFAQPEFDAFAEKNLVLVEIDLPKRKPQSAAVRQANAQLVQKYRVEGFPTLVFLNSKGNEVVRGGYEPGGAKPFVQAVSRSLGLSGSPAGMPVAARTAPRREEPPRDLPLFGGAPPAPEQRFADFVLKGISGTKDRRLALVNNQTLGAGDVAGVKVDGKVVRVRCVEIRERSVVLAIEGQPGTREVQLRDP